MRLWLPILLLMLLLCSIASANTGVAIVKTTKGDVTIKRMGKTLPVSPRDRLQEGDILATGAASRIGIIFNDGSVLSLEANSLLRIKTFIFSPIEEKFNFKLFLNKGAALFESGKIGSLAPERFELETPQGTVGIRGTKFLVEVK